MQTHQNVFIADKWQSPLPPIDTAELVLLFGNRDYANDPQIVADIKKHYPKAEVVGCTTSGEVMGADIYDDSLCLTAMSFDHTRIQVHSASVEENAISDVAKTLVCKMKTHDLQYVLVLSDGQKVNGTELVKGIQTCLPKNVVVTGGLAGDGTRFKETCLWHNHQVASGQIILVGFYGDKLHVGHGCIGGWQAFGPDRTVTKSQSNVLYELDGQPALELYKKYLGEYAQELPASALLFPLVVKTENRKITRTILNINEQDGSMIFAGDIPQGVQVQLMRANAHDLIDGAEIAAEHSLQNIPTHSDNGVALLVSCVGRRLVLKDYTNEELEAVKGIIGDNWAYTGFYSYGELSPLLNDSQCSLHNQTMTITTLCEAG